jgi:hypothetical protein
MMICGPTMIVIARSDGDEAIQLSLAGKFSQRSDHACNRAPQSKLRASGLEGSESAFTRVNALPRATKKWIALRSLQRAGYFGPHPLARNDEGLVQPKIITLSRASRAAHGDDVS